MNRSLMINVVIILLLGWLIALTHLNISLLDRVGEGTAVLLLECTEKKILYGNEIELEPYR